MAFCMQYGSFKYLVMPFGMTNSPATFQLFMNNIFRDMVNVFVSVYLDDILIFSDNKEDHTEHVQCILECLRKHNLHVKLEKCVFHINTIKYIRLIVSPTGIAMDPSKTKVIADWPVPRTVKEVQSFLGFANFYHHFINNYSDIVVALDRLTCKDVPFNWTVECQAMFQNSRTHLPLLPSSCILTHVNLSSSRQMVPTMPSQQCSLKFHLRIMTSILWLFIFKPCNQPSSTTKSTTRNYS